MKSDNNFSWNYRFWYTLFWIFFINIAAFSAIVLLVRPLWPDVDNFLNEMTNFKFKWLMLILILSIIITGYGLFLVIRYSPKNMSKSMVEISLFPKIIIFSILMIWDFMLYLLIVVGGDELGIIRTGLEYISPLIFFPLILLFGFFSQKIISYVIKIWKQIKEQERWKLAFNKNILTLIGIFSLILLGFILPYIIIPVNVTQGEIPSKPKLMAHRGASHLAPENTLIAGKLASDMGAIGWEVDVSISFDGVLFLMHDSNLKRTTDVEEVFPDRKNDDATMFNISELRQLDAGSWFSDDDPYNTISDEFVDLQAAENYRGEKIPTLDEVLNLTRDYNLYLDIDAGRPYESGLNEKIMTKLSSNLTVNMTKVSTSQDIANFLDAEADLLNTIHTLSNEQFQNYQDSNITVMVWTVDTVQRFSQLWFLGVDYVKTNALHLLIPLKNPTWRINSLSYYLIWIIADALCLIAATVEYILKDKENKSEVKKIKK